MPLAELDGIKLNYRIDGDPEGPALVFANSLGTDLHLWDQILPLLPASLRIIRYDMRGHGASEVPQPPYAMGALVRDLEQLLDHLAVRDCALVGLSIGGMVAQGLAAKRLDLIRAVVLSNTGAKIGTRALWEDRIKAIEDGGLEAIVDAVMERWFTRAFRDGPDLAQWRDLMLRTPRDGYVGCCHAIAGTDFMTPTSGLRLPALGIAGSDDGSTPADLVRETIGLIPGSEFKVIRRAGHLPNVEQPHEYAELVIQFLKKIGHLD